MTINKQDLMTVCLCGDADGRRVSAGPSMGRFNGSGTVYLLTPVIDVNHEEPRAFYVDKTAPPTKWEPLAKERWADGVECRRLYGAPTPAGHIAEIRELAARLYGTNMRINLLRLAAGSAAIVETNMRIQELATLQQNILALGATLSSRDGFEGGDLPIVKIIHENYKVEEINYNFGRLWNERMSNGDC
ncbi:hypothetical protein [Achromobacter sp. UMC71]|uniref:hypothetical protein n=1 Tax=Achromobacter sp. UMC71 TaxID=1862320 RepID=UPI0015FF2BC5|nr:hypothetical protein [Achromobacter sp. UMC71]MBB1628944.1 hypothetical protein [Achromobacter sp. UMC71]